MKRAIILGIALTLSGCGGGGPRETVRAPAARAVPLASGPVSKACIVSGREGRSAKLCGCIQAAADLSLTPSQQRRAVAFYADPHLAQVVRQSDKPADERFWEAYVNYGKRAEAMCG